MRARGGRLFVRFEGYDTDAEEPLQDLEAVRFASLGAEVADCNGIVPGTRITGFKRGDDAQYWVDAEVVAKKSGKHEGSKCHCRWGRQQRWRAAGSVWRALHSLPTAAAAWGCPSRPHSLPPKAPTLYAALF